VNIVDVGRAVRQEVSRKGVFIVMRIYSRTRDWPACVKFHAADDTQFGVLVYYGLRDSIDNR
jgi:hypothetical protein